MTRASPSHLSFCRLERGEITVPSLASLGSLFPLLLARCHAATPQALSLGGERGVRACEPAALLAGLARNTTDTQRLHPAFTSETDSRAPTLTESEEGSLHRLSLAGVTNAGCCMTWDTTGTLDSDWRQLCCFMPMSAFCCHDFLREPSPLLPCCRFRRTERRC